MRARSSIHRSIYSRSWTSSSAATRKLSGRGGKTIGSGSWQRKKLAVARLQKKIANRRSDFHWKLANALCEQYDVLVFEKLNLDGLKRRYGRKISDLALYEFLRKLEWVAKKTGRQISLCRPVLPEQQDLQLLRPCGRSDAREASEYLNVAPVAWS